MKRHLLTPPEKDNEILLLISDNSEYRIIDKEGLSSVVGDNIKIGTCHQPYFFNPGVSLKFLLLDKFKCKKYIYFLDTDRINLFVNIPSSEGSVYPQEFLNTDKCLYNFPLLSEIKFNDFFNTIMGELLKTDILKGAAKNVLQFRNIIFNNKSHKLLRDVLSYGFLTFYNMDRNFSFISEITKTDRFRHFFNKIYIEDKEFRNVFNDTVDEFKRQFRVRYKNFPFPKLEKDELPFWIVKNGVRMKLFKRDFSPKDCDKFLIFPRASTLTIFLRLYELDIFIHGTGGANYEWVNDRIIERFFGMEIPKYIVISGTFFIEGYNFRNFPYFYYTPQCIKNRLNSYLEVGQIIL